MSEVRDKADGSAEVIIRVKNGVLYGSAEMRPAGNASTGIIRLMVMINSSRSDLLDALVKGC